MENEGRGNTLRALMNEYKVVTAELGEYQKEYNELLKNAEIEEQPSR